MNIHYDTKSGHMVSNCDSICWVWEVMHTLPGPNHMLVLICIGEQAGMCETTFNVSGLSERLKIAEDDLYGIIGDLINGGYICAYLKDGEVTCRLETPVRISGRYWTEYGQFAPEGYETIPTVAGGSML